MNVFRKILVLGLLVMMLPAVSLAQTEEDYDTARLEQLLAPIALYPDQLMVQVLVAASYPQQVVEAERWLNDPANGGLQDPRAYAVLQQAPWDASVKSLTAFPQVLRMMVGNIAWTERVGEAYLMQQADVLDAVQNLRMDAMDSGALRSTAEINVLAQGSDIVIVPVYPERVYVPTYDPRYVYGSWAYPDYPPYYLSSGSYGVAPLAAAVPLIIIRSFWDEHRWDWQRRRIDDRRIEHPQPREEPRKRVLQPVHEVPHNDFHSEEQRPVVRQLPPGVLPTRDNHESHSFPARQEPVVQVPRERPSFQQEQLPAGVQPHRDRTEERPVAQPVPLTLPQPVVPHPVERTVVQPMPQPAPQQPVVVQPHGERPVAQPVPQPTSQPRQERQPEMQHEHRQEQPRQEAPHPVPQPQRQPKDSDSHEGRGDRLDRGSRPSDNH